MMKGLTMRSRVAVAMLFVSLLFSGCGMSAFHIFKRDRMYEHSIAHTKKGQIVAELQTKAIITATYLNRVDSAKYKGDEYFFVGIYICDDFEQKEKRGLKNPFYALRLGGAAPLEVTELSHDDELTKSMPLVSRWYNYYLVRFPAQERELLLTFESDRFGKAQLKFVKD